MRWREKVRDIRGERRGERERRGREHDWLRSGQPAYVIAMGDSKRIVPHGGSTVVPVLAVPN